MFEHAYVVSDLHLHDKLKTFMFTAYKEAVFARLVTEVKRTNGVLVLNGDVFDLTGMTLPTQESLEAFYERAQTPVCRGHLRRYVEERGPLPFKRTFSERLEALGQTFPDFFAGLRSLAGEKRLKVMPGNHDWELLLPQNVNAFNRLLRVDPDLPMEEQPANGSRYWKTLSVELIHGNDYDPDNRTDQAFSNEEPQGHTSGAIVTYAIYQALIPALAELGKGRFDPERILALDPKGSANVIDEIGDFLDQGIVERLSGAFVQLLRDNGFDVDFLQALMLEVAHVIPAILPWAVRERLSSHNDVVLVERERAVKRWEDAQVHGAFAAVTTGHTHVPDAADHYVNTGTWIDIVRDFKNYPVRSLPVLHVSENGAELREAKDWAAGAPFSDTRVLHALDESGQLLRPGATPRPRRRRGMAAKRATSTRKGKGSGK